MERPVAPPSEAIPQAEDDDAVHREQSPGGTPTFDTRAHPAQSGAAVFAERNAQLSRTEVWRYAGLLCLVASSYASWLFLLDRL